VLGWPRTPLPPFGGPLEYEVGPPVLLTAGPGPGATAGAPWVTGGPPGDW
jgi:hypothetical protein